MELTIKQALHQGISAQKKGDLRKAEFFYKAILESNPKHSDANHNLGILAVSVGKFNTASPYLYTALTNSPDRPQFWLSYIKLLIHLGQTSNATQFLEKAKVRGFNNKIFEQLEVRLNINESSEILLIERIKKFETLFQATKFDEAISWAKGLISQYPNNPVLFNMLGGAYSAINWSNRATECYKKSIEIKPDYVDPYYNLGVIFSGIMDFENAKKNYHRAIRLNPSYAAAYNNLGNYYKHVNNKKKAVTSYKQAIILNPLLYNAIINLGVINRSANRYDQSKIQYLRALKINPNSALAYNNFASTFLDTGQLRQALSNYEKSLELEPGNTRYLENLAILLIQLGTDTYQQNRFLNLSIRCLGANVSYLFLHVELIKNFIEGDMTSVTEVQNQVDRASQQGDLDNLTYRNRQFCIAYNGMIKSLTKYGFDKISSVKNPMIYHIGESHCLSFAHHQISLDTASYTIQPRLIIGAKAWHLANNNPNKYKSLLINHVQSIPNHSNVFISFGEIDCRENEGIFIFKDKTTKNLEDIILETVNGYLNFINSQFRGKRCRLFFLGVPAPYVANAKNVSREQTVREQVMIIKRFNSILKREITSSGNTFIDTYSFTSNAAGISNGKYHMDNRHLGPWAIKEIENQIMISQ